MLGSSGCSYVPLETTPVAPCPLPPSCCWLWPRSSEGRLGDARDEISRVLTLLRDCNGDEGVDETVALSLLERVPAMGNTSWVPSTSVIAVKLDMGWNGGVALERGHRAAGTSRPRVVPCVWWPRRRASQVASECVGEEQRAGWVKQGGESQGSPVACHARISCGSAMLI